MKDDPRSCSYATEHLEKIESYLKRPEELVFETDQDFLKNLDVMHFLAISFKKEKHLSYLPKELKNNEEFMLKLIKERPSAYDVAGLKLSKNPDFAVQAIHTNPETVDSVFFKHENFFNNLQVIHEALKYEQSDFFNVTDEIDEYIHKKNICSKEDLLEMFAGKSRCDYLVKMYEGQVKEHIADTSFIEAVTEKNDFELEVPVASSVSKLKF